jgi:hypothetical protein
MGAQAQKLWEALGVYYALGKDVWLAQGNEGGKKWTDSG